MKFDKNAIIGGYPIKKIRNFLKNLGHDSIEIEYLSNSFKITHDEAKSLLEELVKLDYMEVFQEKDEIYNENNSPLYQITLAGSSLAYSNFLPRIPRQKAETIYKSFMERVAEVNSNDYYLVEVTKVILFGSYLDTNEQELGDVDVAIEIRNKDLPNISDKLTKRSEELHEQTNMSSGSAFSYFMLPRSEVRFFLKSKNKYLHVHDAGEGLFQIIPATEQKIVYPSV
jgi:predicted nucleotidyltransferase